jgi:hypothetical protein
MATASPIPGATTIDQGTGIPNVNAAARWLRAGHRAGRFSIRSLPDGVNRGHTGAFRAAGLGGPSDTLQRFRVSSVTGQPFARLLLRSDTPWLRTPASLEFGGAPATVALSYDAAQLRAPGLYVGTVWARPETDTLAGAAFGLTNTIVVPQPLDRPYELRKYLRAGRAEHLFFSLPEGSGGLHVRVTVRDPDQRATVYLFEPGGRPFRDGSSVEVGGELGRDVERLVRAEDLMAGAYELVVAAPPTAGVTFDLRAAVPPVVIAVDGVTATLTTLSAEAATAAVSAAVIGATRGVTVHGTGTVARRVAVTVPAWANELVLDVQLPERVWTRLTDFALAVWDATGRLVAQHPLNYALSRNTVSVTGARGQVLDVELVPAFALPGDDSAWDATLGLAFLAGEPLAIDRVPELRIPHDRPAFIPVPTLGPTVIVPEGFVPLVEVTARTSGASPAARRDPAGPPTPGATP